MTNPAIEFTTAHSGESEHFASGAKRDQSAGKPRPDLISPKATLREAELMARGAECYGERNWEKGIPTSRFLESALRHILQYQLGDRVEDHLAAARYNLGGIMHFEGTEWDDLAGGLEDDPVMGEQGALSVVDELQESGYMQGRPHSPDLFDSRRFIEWHDQNRPAPLNLAAARNGAARQRG